MNWKPILSSTCEIDKQICDLTIIDVYNMYMRSDKTLWLIFNI